MAIETEAKLRVDSHEPVRERLLALGATPLGRVLETNRIFDRFDGSLRRSGCGLRIRSTVDDKTSERRTALTFKGPAAAATFKSREELEVEVSDADTIARMLELMGFAEILAYQKRRESWRLGDCRIELDKPPRIGLFVEIEGPGEAAIRKVRSDLGLGGAAHVPSSYVRMLVAYCDECGIANRVVNLADGSTPPR